MKSGPETAALGTLVSWFQMSAKRSASAKGSGRNTTVLTTLKRAVLAPIPRPRVRTATATNAGDLASDRRAILRVCRS